MAQTGSTNQDLLAAARAGAAVGTVVRAGHQTAGRGRLGRTWQAPPDTCLLASILLEAGPVPFLAVARVALAASDASHDLAGVDASLKWPNDLLVGELKLAGLLAEADAGSPNLVVGIGCNVAWPPLAGAGGGEQLPEDLRPLVTSLASAAAAAVPGPAQLLEGLLDRLEGWLERAPDAVIDSYRARCATLGRPVRVDLGSRLVEGTATEITPSGELVVAYGGASEVLRAGDVVHVRAR